MLTQLVALYDIDLSSTHRRGMFVSMILQNLQGSGKSEKTNEEKKNASGTMPGAFGVG
jgi:hypothetical protein